MEPLELIQADVHLKHSPLFNPVPTYQLPTTRVHPRFMAGYSAPLTRRFADHEKLASRAPEGTICAQPCYPIPATASRSYSAFGAAWRYVD
jgi:hypothetical protein